MDQRKEIEKAVIGIGEYQFKLAYKSLEISGLRCHVNRGRNI